MLLSPPIISSSSITNPDADNPLHHPFKFGHPRSSSNSREGKNDDGCSSTPPAALELLLPSLPLILLSSMYSRLSKYQTASDFRDCSSPSHGKLCNRLQAQIQILTRFGREVVRLFSIAHLGIFVPG
uniref:Uncharacterized protein n=1 Tax=Opuntia streptacantha TaxID=393608 RepID=A0A7C9A930_OPUST